MFEAVGEKYWPVYFDTLRERLKPGGHATLADHHGAGPPLGDLPRGCGLHPEIHLPRRHAARAQGVARRGGRAGLEVAGSIEFGESYSQTLRRWHETFNDALGRGRGWASTTGSGGCGISTCVLRRDVPVRQ
jgi:cyclopropane-fatty-acyl-phospholipid synthase